LELGWSEIRNRLRSLDHPPGEARGLHRSDYVELLAQASHDAFASLKVRKAIFGGLKLFAGVGGPRDRVL
jgi:hypothetical protein